MPRSPCLARQTTRAPSSAVWKPSRLQAGDMQQNIAARAVVRQDEAVALGDIEPLDGAGHLDEIGSVTVVVGQRFLVDRAAPH